MDERERRIDLRGRYAPLGGPDVIIQNPSDLVAAGISVDHSAIRATWGDAGLEEYLNAFRQRQAEQARQVEVEYPTAFVGDAQYEIGRRAYEAGVTDTGTVVYEA